MRVHIWRRYLPGSVGEYETMCGRMLPVSTREAGADPTKFDVTGATCVPCLARVRDDSLHTAVGATRIAQMASVLHDQEKRKRR